MDKLQVWQYEFWGLAPEAAKKYHATPAGDFAGLDRKTDAFWAEAPAEVQKLRRRIEDRLRKDHVFLGKCAMHFREDCIPVEAAEEKRFRGIEYAHRNCDAELSAAEAEIQRLSKMLLDAGIQFTGQHEASHLYGLASRAPISMRRDILKGGK